MTATAGKSMIVVDDPHGYCVPGEDVLIVGNKAVVRTPFPSMDWILQNPGIPVEHMKVRDVTLADLQISRVINDGPGFRKTRRDQEPRIKGPKKPKQRKLMKGRP